MNKLGPPPECKDPFLAAYARLWKFAYSLFEWCRLYAGSYWQEKSRELMDRLGLSFDHFTDRKERLAYEALLESRQLALDLSGLLRREIRQAPRAALGAALQARARSLRLKHGAGAYNTLVDRLHSEDPSATYNAILRRAAVRLRVDPRTVRRHIPRKPW